MRNPLTAVILGFLLITRTAIAAPSAPRYSVTDMGNLGGDESVAYAINDEGQAAAEAKRLMSTIKGL